MFKKFKISESQKKEILSLLYDGEPEIVLEHEVIFIPDPNGGVRGDCILALISPLEKEFAVALVMEAYPCIAFGKTENFELAYNVYAFIRSILDSIL